MHQRVVERLELGAELQQAIEVNQLEVYYQPVVRLPGHEILGVEALLRWRQPEPRHDPRRTSSSRLPRRPG